MFHPYWHWYSSPLPTTLCTPQIPIPKEMFNCPTTKQSFAVAKSKRWNWEQKGDGKTMPNWVHRDFYMAIQVQLRLLPTLYWRGWRDCMAGVYAWSGSGGIIWGGRVAGRSCPSNFILIKCLARANSARVKAPSLSTSERFHIACNTFDGNLLSSSTTFAWAPEILLEALGPIFSNSSKYSWTLGHTSHWSW